MWLLLFIPVLIIVAVVLAMSALFAGVFWVLGAGWPLLLIGLGVWMFLREDGRHTRHEHRGRGRPWMDIAAEPRPGSRRSGKIEHRPELRQPELPVDIDVKVQQIRRKVDVLLSYADRFPPFSQDLYLVRQTASDYLPRTISAYLALMKRADSDKPVSADGKSAYEELKAQLDLLDSRLDDIAQDLQRQDADRLVANRRFLEARFSSRESRPVLDGEPTAVV